MMLNRAYLVFVSQDVHPAGDAVAVTVDGGWESIWAGQGGVRVFAIDRERHLTPVPVNDLKALLDAPSRPSTEVWNGTPPVKP
jgi:hypothetical protein